MNHRERITLLKEIDLFSSFDTNELESFATALEEIQITAGTVLCSEGDPGQDMFILLDGTLQIFKDKRAITTIQPIDYIGEMSIIEKKPRSATVIASTPARLFRITSAQFQEYLASQPPSLVAMMQTLSQRIRNDTRQLASEYEKANILIHDMRNSMSAFLLLELMTTAPLNPIQHHYLDLMRKSRQDVATMMDEALANAKRLNFPKRLEINSLPVTLDAIPVTLSCHPDLKGKTITIKHLTSIPDFAFNHLDINRVITNLVINAGQASPPQGQIKITTAFKQGHAVVEVTDYGTGIPKEIQSKIFTPQFSTKPDGNGLGLTSCQEIITRYGGALTCMSKKDTGATFRFTLPISPPNHDRA